MFNINKKELLDHVKVKGIKVINNLKTNQIELFFKKKPNGITRDFIKEYGYCYLPAENKWVVNSNDETKKQLKFIMHKLSNF